jgi:hypothetical protein
MRIKKCADRAMSIQKDQRQNLFEGKIFGVLGSEECGQLNDPGKQLPKRRRLRCRFAALLRVAGRGKSCGRAMPRRVIGLKISSAK